MPPSPVPVDINPKVTDEGTVLKVADPDRRQTLIVSTEGNQETTPDQGDMRR